MSLLQIGRIKLSLDPPLLLSEEAASPGAFEQTLHFSNASITVTTPRYTVVAWVAHGVIRLEISHRQGAPFTARGTTLIWRNATYHVPSYGGGPCGCGACSKINHTRHADKLAALGSHSVAWYHRNELRPEIFRIGGSLWEQEVRFAKLDDAIAKGYTRDPLTNRTFGAALRGEGAGAVWRRVEVRALHFANPSLNRVVHGRSPHRGSKPRRITRHRDHVTPRTPLNRTSRLGGSRCRNPRRGCIDGHHRDRGSV